MSILSQNEFTAYDLTADEYLQGCLLTIAQKEVIQTLRASVASEKLSLILDVNNVHRFAQQEADLKGKLAILTHILDCSEAAELQLRDQNYSQPVIHTHQS